MAAVTNASTTSARTTAGVRPATPETARTAWPRMAVLGATLVALGLLGLVRDGGGDRVLLGGVGLVAVVRGAGALRAARSGDRSRAAAVSGAVAVWLGLVAVAVALLSGTATAWVLVAALALVLPALAVAGGGRPGLWAVAAAVLLGGVLLGVLGGAATLLAVGTATAAGLVTVLGLANVLGAVGMLRIARRPAPAPAAGCAGCACGAGGCGSAG